MQALERTLTAEQRYRLYAKGLQLWRVCPRGKCLRARRCSGDPQSCFHRIGDWAKDVVHAAELESSRNDPNAQALRAELAERVRRMCLTERPTGTEAP
jgi:hypothetical protein